MLMIGSVAGFSPLLIGLESPDGLNSGEQKFASSKQQLYFNSNVLNFVSNKKLSTGAWLAAPCCADASQSHSAIKIML